MIARMIRSTGYSGLGRFFSTLGNMVFVLVVSQRLDATALGTYGLLFFFIQLFSGICPLGHPMYLAREVAHLRDDPLRLGRVIGQGLSALVWGGLLSLVVWGGLSLFYHQVSGNLLALSVVAGMLWGVEYLLAGILIGLERLAVNAFWHGVSLGLIVYALFFQTWLPLSLSVLLVIRILATLVGLAGRVWAVRDLGAQIAFQVRLTTYRASAFFWYSGWVFLASRQLDVLVLSFIMDEATLGGYFLALRIFLTFGIVAEVLGVALTPFISRAYHGVEDRTLGWLLRLVLLGIGGVGSLLGLGFYLARDWIIAFFNPQLVGAVSPLLAPLAWVVPFSFGNHLVGAFYSATDYQRRRFYINLAVLVLSTVLLLLLAGPFSVMGAIWVKAGSEGLLFVSLVFMLPRGIGQKNKAERRGAGDCGPVSPGEDPHVG